MVHRFSAVMDNLAKTLTFVVFVVILIPFISIFNLYRKEQNPWILVAPAVIVIVLVIAALYRTKEYSLDGEGLHIHRPIGDAVFPLHRFRSVASVTSKELGFGIRTFGSGGFFGYFGKFYYKKIGAVTLYVTDREKMLLIVLDDDRKIIISPEDPAAFMAAFHELMKR
jgi:hypothetical protein